MTQYRRNTLSAKQHRVGLYLMLIKFLNIGNFVTSDNHNPTNYSLTPKIMKYNVLVLVLASIAAAAHFEPRP